MLVLAFAESAPVHALGRDRHVRQYHHQSWTPRQGAPSQIWSLAQSADGYLWIGSATGLFRFDGMRFERYVAPEGSALPSHNVVALFAPPEGGLHVSFRSGGAAYVGADGIKVTVSPDDTVIRRPIDYAREPGGRVWGATASGPAWFDGQRWQLLGADAGLPSGPATFVFVDRNGALWTCVANRLWFRPRDAESFQMLEGEVGQVARFAEGPDGTLWMAETTRSVRRVPVPGTPADALDVVAGSINLKFDADGSLWASSLGDGIKRLRAPEAARTGDAVEEYRQVHGLSSDYTTAVLVDREGSLWIGSDKGLDRFRVGRLIPVAVPAGHAGLTLAADDNGAIWVGSDSSQPMLRIADDQVAVMPLAKDAPYTTGMNAVYRDARGGLWWGGVYGLWEQRGESFAFHGLPPGIEQAGLRFHAIHGEPDGSLTIETSPNALYRYHDGTWTRIERAPGVPDTVPSAAHIDDAGQRWLGYGDGRVFVVEGAVAREMPDPVVGRVQVIRGRGDTHWIGGEQGLAKWREGAMRRVELDGPERLINVTAIVAARSGDLWVAHSQGILRIAAVDLASAAGMDPLRVRAEHFGFLDCLPGAPQVNVLDSAAIEGSDGRLWFATDAGLAIVDPRQLLRAPGPPPVSITALTTDRGEFAPAPGLRLPIGTRSLRIAYRALSLAEPERRRFRYLLEGVDEDWNVADARREAAYTNLAPGDYRFRVIAGGDNEIWTDPGADLAFSIPPALWQTTPFRILVVLGAVGLLALLYWLRLRQLSAAIGARQQERQIERERIARELHDTLLQGIHGLILRFQAGVERIPRAEPARAILERALDRADEVLAEGRDRVRDLRSPGGAGSELSQDLAVAGNELAQDGDAAFTTGVDGEPRPLHPIVYDEVLRVAREALINAFAHAHARAIEADVVYGRQELRVVVRDDGRGIDPAVLEAGGNPGHWGLMGMRERAYKIGAHLDIRCAPGAGTAVEVRVPASVAYRVQSDGGRRRWWRREPAGD